jgi:nucleoside-triphosphatase THEP1
VQHPSIVTLTGAPGCGKTTVCERAVALARSQGWQVAGLLTLPRTSAGRTIGLDVEDVLSGERLALAEERGPTDGPSTGRWHFHRRALEWGSARLDAALSADLLIIDELGPLELVLGLGWANGVSVLDAGRYSLGLVVVRPSLLPLLRLRLPATEAGTVVVGADNRDQLPRDLVGWLARPA